MKNKNLQKIIDAAKSIANKKDAEISLLKAEIVEQKKTLNVNMATKLSVDNFPNVQKTEVINQKEVQKVELMNPKEVQDVRVLNGVPEVQKVEITNLEKAPEVQKVHITNQEKAPDVQKVEVTNQEKASEWVPSFLVGSIKSLGDLWINLWTAGIKVRLDDGERDKPQAVYLVDSKGKPIKFPSGNGDGGAIRYGLNLPMIGRGNQSFTPLTVAISASLDQYKISDADETGAIKYYGFLDADGAWYIMEENTTANTYRYSRGSSAYTTAWTGRAGLTYGYFNVVF